MLKIARLKEIVEGLLNYLTYDSLNNPEEKTFLYILLNGVKDHNYDFYKESKKLFLRTQENARKIDVRMEYPKDIASLPLYIVREPSRNKGAFNSIGKLDGDFIGASEGYFGREEYRNSEAFTFEILCASVNLLESILMSEVLYALFVGAHETIASEFLNPAYSLDEVIVDTSLMPTPLFMRNIKINLTQDELIPSISPESFADSLEFEYPPKFYEGNVEY